MKLEQSIKKRLIKLDPDSFRYVEQINNIVVLDAVLLVLGSLTFSLNFPQLYSVALPREQTLFQTFTRTKLGFETIFTQYFVKKDSFTVK